MKKKILIGKFKTVRSKPKSKKIPTPPAMAKVKASLLTNGKISFTWSPKTCMSGSAAVTIKPIAKAHDKSSGKFFFATSAEPHRSPIGSIPIPTPIKKIVRPKINKRPPTTKRDKSSFSSGTIVSPKARTISMTGKTDFAVSLNLAAMSINRHFIAFALLAQGRLEEKAL